MCDIGKVHGGNLKVESKETRPDAPVAWSMG